MHTTDTRAAAERSRRRGGQLVGSATPASEAVFLPSWPKAVIEKTALEGRPVGPIGYVLDRFPQPSQRFVRDEILELGRCGVNVHVFAVEPAADSLEEPWLSGSLGSSFRVPATSFLADVGPEASERRTIQMQARWIAREVVSKQIRHLHGTELATADVAREVRRSTGVRYSFTVAGSEIYHDRRDPRSLRDKMCEAEFVVVPSDISRQQLLAATGAGAPRNVHRIYRGVDLERFRFCADLGRDPDSVLAVCPLEEESGMCDLIEAIGILRDRRRTGVRATIVGEGELEPQLRARIASLGLEDHVTLLGGGDATRLLSLMRGHAVMALPYRVLPGEGRDGVPAALLEAMAVGLPVVSTCVMGMSEVLEDGWTGRLVAPDDPRWLAGALETMLDNVRLRTRMAKDARQHVERHFALSRNVSQLARLFASAAAARNAAR